MRIEQIIELMKTGKFSLPNFLYLMLNGCRSIGRVTEITSVGPGQKLGSSKEWLYPQPS
jgi:hypothetical protein